MLTANKERIVIEIDSESGDYKVDISFCNLKRMRAVLQALLKGIDSGEILLEPEVEVYDGIQ